MKPLVCKNNNNVPRENWLVVPDWIRVFTALGIFFCHVGTYSGTDYGRIIGQFLNVGVPIFFMLSGFLYSQKKRSVNILVWYEKQLRKILVPLYVFLLFVAILYFFIGIKVSTWQWFSNIIPIVGLTESYMPGCGPLWFVTHLLVCYLLTPFLPQSSRLTSHQFVTGLLLYLVVIALAAYTIPAIYGVLIHSIGSYLIGFYLLPHIKTDRFRSLSLWLGVVAIVIRIGGKMFCDGSFLYDRILVDLSHKTLAVAIIGVFTVLIPVFSFGGGTSVLKFLLWSAH